MVKFLALFFSTLENRILGADSLSCPESQLQSEMSITNIIPIVGHKDDSSDDEFEWDRQSFDMLAWDRLDSHWDDTFSWLQYMPILDVIASAVAKKAGVPEQCATFGKF